MGVKKIITVTSYGAYFLGDIPDNVVPICGQELELENVRELFFVTQAGRLSDGNVAVTKIPVLLNPLATAKPISKMWLVPAAYFLVGKDEELSKALDSMIAEADEQDRIARAKAAGLQIVPAGRIQNNKDRSH